MLKPEREVGIIGYAAYVPRYRLPASEVNRVWAGGAGGIPVKEKSVPGLDEDVVTMSIEAARNALARAGDVDPALVRAVWVGSESHPYAVKPTSTIVAEAIGATPHTQGGDWEFACKAGTEALQAAIGFVGSGMAQYALSIGMDTAQARPGDALEYTASAGGAAYLVGPAMEALAVFENLKSSFNLGITWAFIADAYYLLKKGHEYDEAIQRSRSILSGSDLADAKLAEAYLCVAGCAWRTENRRWEREAVVLGFKAASKLEDLEYAVYYSQRLTDLDAGKSNCAEQRVGIVDEPVVRRRAIK